MPITHTFVSAIQDDAVAAAAGEVLPSHWNAGHTIALTTAEVTESTDKNYVTDAQLTVIGSTSGTNSGNQNVFTKIAVAGQSDVVADSAADTLTLVAGTNVTITTDASTDTVTIAASGGGGSGDVVGPSSATDNALARFDTTTGKLLQNSAASVSDNGALTLVGATITTSEPIANWTQTWNASGVTFTGFKINIASTASASASLIADWQVDSSSVFGVTKFGGWKSADAFVLTASGKFQIYNTAGTLGLMVYNSTGLAIKAGQVMGISSSTTDATNAPDVAFSRLGAASFALGSGANGNFAGSLKLTNLVAVGVVNLGVFTVATLPSASTSGQGACAYVTDATANTYDATLTGGGSTKIGARSDGTNWKAF